MTPQESLFDQWDRVVGPWVASLMKEGIEGAILAPLANEPAAAMTIVGRVRSSDDCYARKIAARLAGYLGPGAPPEILDELLEAERARHLAPRTSMETFDTQSVVEDVVFAANRWCRHPQRKPAGLAVLRKVVERTLSGEYWNTSSYAMTGLVRHAPDEATDLLARFCSFAEGAPPDHPSRPSLSQEKSFAQALKAGKCDAIEKSLDAADVTAAAVTWDEEAEAALAQFMSAARRIQ